MGKNNTTITAYIKSSHAIDPIEQMKTKAIIGADTNFVTIFTCSFFNIFLYNASASPILGKACIRIEAPNQPAKMEMGLLKDRKTFISTAAGVSIMIPIIVLKKNGPKETKIALKGFDTFSCTTYPQGFAN